MNIICKIFGHKEIMESGHYTGKVNRIRCKRCHEILKEWKNERFISMKINLIEKYNDNCYFINTIANIREDHQRINDNNGIHWKTLASPCSVWYKSDREEELEELFQAWLKNKKPINELEKSNIYCNCENPKSNPYGKAYCFLCDKIIYPDRLLINEKTKEIIGIKNK